ncbi:MAG: MarR family transcriptional regulator [Oscillospiraceae bacterium]|nr:MarR family transcriptional regulator [Oscillospiraceae bacterium]
MESISKYINRIARCSVLYRSARLAPSGLNGHQHSYILQICHKPGISQDELAELIYVNKSNVTRQLTLLEKNGFISRRACPHDRRSLQVFPTAKAYAILPEIETVLTDWNDMLCQGFTAADKQQLIELLQLLMQRAKTQADAAVSAAAADRAEHKA